MKVNLRSWARSIATLALGLTLMEGVELRGAEPSLSEILGLARTNLVGQKDGNLEHAAVRGLLAQIPGQLMLVDTNTPATPTGELITRTNLMDGAFGYVRISNVRRGLAEAVGAALTNVAGGLPLKGLILDLRYTTGDDYREAAAAADPFIVDERELLHWGDGSARSTAKAKAAWSAPIMVLVNPGTSGAPEALAAMLRQANAALLLGGTTAGKAFLYKDFSLSTGQKLRIATQALKLADGTALTDNGVIPDIQVSVTAADELVYYQDPYKVLANATNATAQSASLTRGSTNPPVRRRISEADLVRQQRQGGLLDADASAPIERDLQPARPLVKDPALARALDLLKGLAVVRDKTH